MANPYKLVTGRGRRLGGLLAGVGTLVLVLLRALLSAAKRELGSALEGEAYWGGGEGFGNAPGARHCGNVTGKVLEVGVRTKVLCVT